MSRRRRSGWVLPTVLIGVVVGAVGLAFALSDRTLSGRDTSDTSVASQAPGGATSLPAVTTSPATLPPTTPPTTVPAVPSVPELIPGFPATDDLATFLAQLEANPGIAGPQGEEVARDLRRLLEEDGRKKVAERADELIAHLHDWEEKGEVDSVLAVALVDLVRPLTDDDGDDDDD